MKNELKALIINIFQQLVQLINNKEHKKDIISKLYGVIQSSDFKDKDYRDSKLKHLLQEGRSTI